MDSLLAQIQLYTEWEPPHEQALRQRASEIEAQLAQQRQKPMDRLDAIQFDYACRLLEEQTQLKFAVLRKLSKEAVSDLGVLQILEQITRVVTEENVKADAILGNIRQSTDVLRTVGISHDQIANSAAVGRTLVGDIKQHEAKDKLIIGALFGLFVLVSVIIIARRLWKLAKPLIKAGKVAISAVSTVAKAVAGKENAEPSADNITAEHVL